MLQQQGLKPTRSGFDCQARAHGRRLVLCPAVSFRISPFGRIREVVYLVTVVYFPPPSFLRVMVLSQIQFTFFPFAGFNSINFIAIQLMGVKIFFLSQKEIKACLL